MEIPRDDDELDFDGFEMIYRRDFKSSLKTLSYQPTPRSSPLIIIGQSQVLPTVPKPGIGNLNNILIKVSFVSSSAGINNFKESRQLVKITFEDETV